MGTIKVRMLREGEAQERWDRLMREHHYLGLHHLPGEPLRYVAEERGEWVALVGITWAFLNVPTRDRYIGWSEEQKKLRLKFVGQNTRFLILPEVKRRNLASEVLGQVCRRVSDDCSKEYGHPLLLLETFVDTARFQGTCYHAAGWKLIGKTYGVTKTGAGYVPAGSKKLLFIKELGPEACAQLCSAYPLLGTGIPLKRQARQHAQVGLLALDAVAKLAPVLATIKDPRDLRGQKHPFAPLLLLAIVAVLAGANSINAMARWGALLTVEARKALGFKRHRAPSDHTFRGLLQKMKPEDLDSCFAAISGPAKTEGPLALAVDGKTLRGSKDSSGRQRHILSAIIHHNGVCIAQREVGEKTNEIPELLPLLKEQPLEGAVVTVDALHTQRKTAKWLVEEKNADYIMQVKDNQQTLLADLKALDDSAFSPGGIHH